MCGGECAGDDAGAPPARAVLAALPGSAREARAFIRDAVRRGAFGVDINDLVLVTSELVTNAVLHGRGPIELTVAVGAGGVRVEVADSAPEAELPWPREDGGESGRGLLIVSRICRSWGVTRGPRHKAVWAVLAP